MRKQTKDILWAKYDDYKQKYKIEQNYYFLKNFSESSKKDSQSSSFNESDPLNQQLESLKRIKQNLNQIENGLNIEIQNMESKERGPFEICEDFVKIKDEKDLEYIIMKKTIEDYLVYLRKGYEKKLVSFDDMVNQTRSLSREIFSIDYLRKQRKNL